MGPAGGESALVGLQDVFLSAAAAAALRFVYPDASFFCFSGRCNARRELSTSTDFGFTAEELCFVVRRENLMVFFSGLV